MSRRSPLERTTYSSFLQLPTLLRLQDAGESDDQLLFVVIHQSHELWFKLFLHELDVAVDLIDRDAVAESLRTVERMTAIFQTLVAQWSVLDTMSPRGYLAFRDRLATGSGFQSAQFREIEFAAGLPSPDYLRSPWLRADERARLEQRLTAPTLRDTVLTALVRHRSAVEDVVRGNADPLLCGLAERLVDLDEAVMHWRARHVLAVERQIGEKRGTGCSSGVAYLRSTTTRRFFPELWDARSTL